MFSYNYHYTWRNRSSMRRSTEDKMDGLEAELIGNDGSRALHFTEATIVSGDPAVPDLARAEMLVQQGKIVAIASTIDGVPEDAIRIDCSGHILMPGFVDGHRHSWQGVLRRIASDGELRDYLAITHAGAARHYTPEDMYTGTRVALTGALDNGITTVLDLSHNSRSSAHSDAVFEAYRSVGIRAVHAAAPPNAGDWDEQLPGDIERLAQQHGSGSISSVRMAVDLNLVRPAEELFDIARSFGLDIHYDGVMGPASSDAVVALGESGRLGPDVTIVHATTLSDAAWDQIRTHGVRIVLAAVSDEQLRLAGGVPPIQRCLDEGIRPGLSIDNETSLAGDMFTQMRATMYTQRMFAAAERNREDGGPASVSNDQVLEMATLAGAESCGVGGIVGSLEVGKEADLLLVEAEAANNLPLNSAVGTIVHGVDRGNIRAVFVRGAVKKWNGSLIGVDLSKLRAEAIASRDRLLSLSGFRLTVNGPEAIPELADSGLNRYLDDHDRQE